MPRSLGSLLTVGSRSETDIGDLMTVEVEDTERGVYANDTKLGAKRAWGRFSKTLLADKPTLDSVLRKVSIVETQFDLDTLRHRFENKDVVVLEGQDALETARELEYNVGSGVEIVVIKNRQILQKDFGVIPDNPISTSRYLKRSSQSLTGKYAYLECDSTTHTWKEVG